MIMSRFPDAQFEPAPEPQEPAAQPITDEQRLERRNPMIRMGTVHYDYESTPARLRNISSAGATIETSAALAKALNPCSISAKRGPSSAPSSGRTAIERGCASTSHSI